MKRFLIRAFSVVLIPGVFLALGACNEHSFEANEFEPGVTALYHHHGAEGHGKGHDSKKGDHHGKEHDSHGKKEKKGHDDKHGATSGESADDLLPKKSVISLFKPLIDVIKQ